MKNQKVPWVFWIRIEKRDWFCNFWKNRLSNSMEFQFFKIYISIGMPWHKQVVKYYMENYPCNLSSIISTNKTFNKWYHFHFKKSYPLN